MTTDSLFWIRTNYGLDLFDPDSKHVESHTCFQGMYRVVTRSSDEVIVITQDNKFSYYDRTRHEFAPTRPMQQGRYADILEMVLDDEGNLWSFSRKGIFCMPVKIPADGQGDTVRGNTTDSPAFAPGIRVPRRGPGFISSTGTMCSTSSTSKAVRSYI